MEFQYITNPKTNRKCRVSSPQGRRIINNYIKRSQLGGGCAYTKKTNRCKKSDVDQPELCQLNSTGRCAVRKTTAPKRTRATGSKAKSSPLPPGIHEVTISKVTSGEAKELAKVIADHVNGPFVMLNIAKIYLEGTPIASGNKVVFRISIQDPDYDVDYFMEQIVDEDNVSVGPEQDLWFNTVSRHTVSVRS